MELVIASSSLVAGKHCLKIALQLFSLDLWIFLIGARVFTSQLISRFDFFLPVSISRFHVSLKTSDEKFIFFFSDRFCVDILQNRNLLQTIEIIMVLVPTTKSGTVLVFLAA
jgi:hypothetical protein